MKFRVWAPHAKSLEIEIFGRRVPMQAGGGGWHEIGVDVPGGTDYSFVVDGGKPRPDPRSPFQPQGIHGPSRTIPHEPLDRLMNPRPPGQLADQVIYELHIGTFTPDGTLDSAIQRLDHLVHLGVTTVELMPVAQFPGERGWGYDGVDIYAPHNAYGGPEALKRFVDACHVRDLSVILDVVYNHVGPDGNYLREFGPYFSDRYATPWGEAVNFDGPYSDEVRAFFIDNAVMWLRDYQFDGLRIDAVHAIVDTSAFHILEELAERVAALEGLRGYKPWLIAESDLNDPRMLRPPSEGGYGIDAQWSDDFHHSLHALLTGERDGYYGDFGRVIHVAKALRNAYVYDGMYSEFRKRRHGRPPHGLSGDCFVGYIQNHDQVGNRARGERIGALTNFNLHKIAAALVLTSPFVPMLFHGEEWGATTPWLYFTDHQNAELARAVTEGRVAEFAAFGWRPEDVPDPQDARTFEASKLDWSEQDRDEHADILDWHRRLIDLRRTTTALTDGRMDLVETALSDSSRCLVAQRGPVTAACNFSGADAEIEAVRPPGDLYLASPTPPARVTGRRIALPAEGVAIFVDR